MNTVMSLAGAWAGWALAHLEFGSSVNPIPSWGADYAHHITDCPPGFENLTTSLGLAPQVLVATSTLSQPGRRVCPPYTK